MDSFRRRTMVSDKIEYPLGIWAYYSDDSIKDYEHADSNAIGVAVITENCQFVIGKTWHIHGENARMQYGGNDLPLNDIGVVYTSSSNTALADYDGYNNSIKIASALDNHVDDRGITGCPVIEECMADFDGNGYLGALGEIQEIYNNKTQIQNIFSKIGGTQYWSWYTWSSTLGNLGSSTKRIWSLRLSNGSTEVSQRYIDNYYGIPLLRL